MSRVASENVELSLAIRLLAVLARIVVGTIMLLNRKTIRGDEHLIQAQAAGRSAYVGFWHGYMLPALWHLRRYQPVGLVSPSDDGLILGGLASSWGYRLIWGSSNRSSRAALRKLARAFNKPGTVLVTAFDGPRGPARQAKPGSLAMAVRHGALLIPIASAASRHWTFHKSWDHFQMPKPFGHIAIQIGAPVPVDPHMDADELARLTSEHLDRTQAEADAVAAQLA